MRGKEHNYFEEQLKAVENPLPELQETFDKELDILKKLCNGKKVLDIGCGGGRPADKLAKFCKEIICIDNDERAVEIAKKKLSKIKNAKVLQMDAFNMDFSDNTFDISYATYNLIGAVDFKEKFMKEILRVTKKGGDIAVFTWKRDKETTDFLKKYYVHIGFEIKDINEDRTITDKWVFERMDPNSILELFKKIGLKSIETKDVGVWVAVLGKKA